MTTPQERITKLAVDTGNGKMVVCEVGQPPQLLLPGGESLTLTPTEARERVEAATNATEVSN